MQIVRYFKRHVKKKFTKFQKFFRYRVDIDRIIGYYLPVTENSETEVIFVRNLSAEMARYGVSTTDIQALLGCSNKTVTNKLTDSTAFSVSEAIKIRDAFFPGLRIEYLFARAEQDSA